MALRTEQGPAGVRGDRVDLDLRLARFGHNRADSVVYDRLDLGGGGLSVEATHRRPKDR